MLRTSPSEDAHGRYRQWSVDGTWDAAEGFYRLVDAANERRALAVSSNLHPSGFDEIMPKALATATVDRLLHHAHVVVTQSESFRLTEATTGKGVMPLR